MTTEPSTSPEAVEALARDCAWYAAAYLRITDNPGIAQRVFGEADATLRALLAEADALREQIGVLRYVLTVAERGGDGPDVELANECAILTGANQRLTAEADALRRELAEARESNDCLRLALTLVEPALADAERWHDYQRRNPPGVPLGAALRRPTEEHEHG